MIHNIVYQNVTSVILQAIIRNCSEQTHQTRYTSLLRMRSKGPLTRGWRSLIREEILQLCWGLAISLGNLLNKRIPLRKQFIISSKELFRGIHIKAWNSGKDGLSGFRWPSFLYSPDPSDINRRVKGNGKAFLILGTLQKSLTRVGNNHVLSGASPPHSSHT